MTWGRYCRLVGSMAHPDLRAGRGNGRGIDGWNWRPWSEGRALGRFTDHY